MARLVDQLTEAEPFVLRIADEPLLVIECDGYEFHSTPAQASEDRRRDRVLQQRGIRCFRYPAADIMQDKSKVAREIVEFIDSKVARELERDAWEACANADLAELEYYRCDARWADSETGARIGQRRSLRHLN